MEMDGDPDPDSNGQRLVDFTEFCQWWKKKKDNKDGLFASAKQAVKMRAQETASRIEAKVHKIQFQIMFMSGC